MKLRVVSCQLSVAGWKSLLVWLTCLPWATGTVLAQQKPAPANAARPAAVTMKEEADGRYARGKVELSQQRYENAMEALQPIIITSGAQWPVTNAATYLWAVAALQAQKAREAEPVLRRLREQQPQWAGIPDVILLQAQLAEALGDRERARTILNELPADRLQAEKQALLDRLGFGAAAEPKPISGPLRVVALLPLNLDNADPRRSQFGQELYAGLRLAADSLNGQDSPVELKVVELGNDTMATKDLLARLDLGAVDLIVGPVYKAPSRLVARAAAARQVPVVNPLTEDGTLLTTGPSLYLLRPSVQTQGRAAARLAARFEPKTAVLLVEETKDDAAFAAAFRAEYESLGGRVTEEQTVSSQTYRTRMTEKVGALPVDSAAGTGVLVVVSDEKNCAQQVLNRLQRDELRLPVIAPASWLEMPELSLDELSEREFYFLAPAYRDAVSANCRRFRRAWQQRFGVPPSDYGRAGFELLYWFGPLVRQYGGAGLSTGLSQRGVGPAPMLHSIGYPNGARDNQGVTVLRLAERRIEVVRQ